MYTLTETENNTFQMMVEDYEDWGCSPMAEDYCSDCIRTLQEKGVITVNEIGVVIYTPEFKVYAAQELDLELD